MNSATRPIFSSILGLSLCTCISAAPAAPGAVGVGAAPPGFRSAPACETNIDPLAALSNRLSVLRRAASSTEDSIRFDDLPATPTTVMLPGQRRPRVALALGGGGCKALAQIGVLRALEQHHFKFDCIVGTSCGAIIGSLYAAGVPLDEIQRLAEKGDLQKALAPSVVARILLSPVKHLLTVGSKRYPGLTSANKLVKLLHKKLPANFSDMQIPFIAVATDLHEGTTYMINSGDTARAVLASSAVPGIVRPVQIGGHIFADGGLRANLPSACARATGAQLVIAVLTDNPIEPEPLRKFKNLKSIAMRVTDLMEAEIDRHHLKDADIVIYPDAIASTPGITKDPKIVRQAVLSGQSAAEAVLPELQQLAGSPNGAVR